MKTASKISISIILTALISAATFSGLSYWQSRIALRDAAFADVEALRDAKAAQIEAFFEDKIKATDTIAANPQVASALTDMQTAFRRINQGGELVLADESSIVREFYERRILPQIAKSKGETSASFEVYGPKSRAARHLQNIFIVQPPSDRAPRRNTYAAAHAFYHPPMEMLAKTYGFSDMFLIDIETGNIIYSVAKNIDFGSDIFGGNFKDTALGQVADKAKMQTGTHVSDIDLYVPATGMAAAFTAAPIYKDGAIIGLLALQMQASEVSALSASGIKGRADRDVYLVGGDNLMRSNAPFAQENLNAYIRLLERANIDDAVADKVKLGKSTILAQSVDSTAVSAALRGQTGAVLTENYFGQSVASAYAPVDIGANDWVIIAERNAVDIFAPLDPFARQLGIAAAIFLPLLILWALWMGWRMMRPARRFMESAATLAEGNNILFREDKTEWGRIGAEMNKYVGRDPWELSLISTPKRRERRTRSPIQLIAVDTDEDLSIEVKKENPKPEPKPETKPDAGPAPKIDVEPMPAPESKSVSKAKPKPKADAKAEPKLAAKPELTKSEKRALAKVEKRAKIRAEKEAIVDARMKAAEEKRKTIEAERKARAEAREKADAERQAKIDAEVKAREAARDKAAADRKAKAEKEAKERSDKQAALEAERKTKTEAREKAIAEKEAKAEAEIKAKADARAKAAAEQQAKVKARQDLEAEQRAAADAERKAKAESARKAAEAVEAKAEARIEAARQIQKAREERIAKARPVKKRKRAARSDVATGSSKSRTSAKRKTPTKPKPESKPKTKQKPKAETPKKTEESAKQEAKLSDRKKEASVEKPEDMPPLTETTKGRSWLRRRR